MHSIYMYIEHVQMCAQNLLVEVEEEEGEEGEEEEGG